ncbi:hypothetical protein ACFOU2_21470 [Bacillus songklensis]|uniref:Glucose-6-phosphate 1-dehydrogenase n=1 Tax=Bacillus songklensis TaxID=1069116 RepID=A0ABV8B9A3_9BACI
MESMTFVLFGATGDLARRKIFPALYQLFLEQKLPSSVAIIGSAKGEKTDEEFRADIHDSLETFSKQVDELDPNFDDFLDMFHYCALDARNKTDYRKLLELVQNLQTLRFANSIFEPLWNHHHIVNVQITASELVGVEGRADYYEKSGALRDMFQNHLLQILMLVAMEPPNGETDERVHEKKKDVLTSLRPIHRDNTAKHIIRGQYGQGETDGHRVIAYRQEPGIDPLSQTETFIAARLYIDNPRWSGVPFYIRTGKRMNKKMTKIVVEFKQPINRSSNQKNEGLPPNLLEIQISPSNTVSFRINSKDLVEDEKTEQVELDFKEASKDVQEAYERLLFDAFKGNDTFFARWGEVEAAWKFVQPILDAFQEGLSLYEYPAGSRGPKVSHKLLQEDGFKWW